MITIPIINRGQVQAEEKIIRFHQFVQLEKGPFNTAIIDLLKGNVYQVENEIIGKMEQGKYEEIREFIESAQKEELLIEVTGRTWIPGNEWEIKNIDEKNNKDEELNIELHLEEGISLNSVIDKLRDVTIQRIIFYGEEIPKTSLEPGKIEKKFKNFKECTDLAIIEGNFSRITKTSYLFNKKFNSCWGCTIAITVDGIIRPCIHSGICIGDINAESFNIEILLEKLKEYWYLTKDKVKKCRDCELRYICFDCREIALREGGDLFSAPSSCKYNPYKGTWEK